MQISRLFAGGLLAALLLLPALSPAQTLSIVSGNGQLVCPDCAGGPTLNQYAPLIVQVNNSSNQPMANTVVTWVATQQGLSPVTSTSTTASNGQAMYHFTGEAFFFGFNFLPATVVATVGTASVTFNETTALPDSAGSPSAFASLSTSNGAAPNLSGQVGQSASTPITVNVFSFSGAVANVSVALVPTTTTGPSVSCAPQAGAQPGAQPGIVLTGTTGTVTCTPVFGGKVGTGQYSVVIGGKLAIFGPENLTVTAGPPAIISYVKGNNQTVNPGAVAPIPLTALVTDLGLNPSDNATVTWSVSPVGSATLADETTVTPTTGLVSAIVTDVGPGPISITVALAGKTSVSYTFTLNVNTVITALQQISGNGQSTSENAAFANPLIVQANDVAAPVPGATVTFAVTGGSATLSQVTSSSTSEPCPGSSCEAVTNSSGQAEILVTAGPTAGQVTVTASVSGQLQTFTLTVIPPGPTIISVLNSAGFASSPKVASPCSLVTIYGTGLAPGIQGVADAYIAPQNQVDGVTVAFAGISAPILYVANVSNNESVSVQVPCNVSLSTTSTVTQVPMVVTVNGASSTPFNVPVTEWSPGIFQFVDSDGHNRAVLIRPDGSVASVTNPARAGETVRMFATGLGQTNPGLFTGEIDPLTLDSGGQLVPSVLPLANGILVGVNGNGVLVVGAEYAFFGVGVYEVDFVIPTNVTPGNNDPLDIVIYQGQSDFVFGNLSQIAIQ